MKIEIIKSPRNGSPDKYELVGRRHCGNGNDACYASVESLEEAIKEAIKRWPKKLTITYQL